MKKLLFSSVLFILFVFAACQGNTEIRFAHEVPDAPRVDVYLNGILLWRDVAFRNVTRYAEFQGNSAEIRVTVADTTTPVLITNVQSMQVPITVSAVNYSSRSLPSEGRSIVRAVHVSPDVPAVDVYFQTNNMSPLVLFATNLQYLKNSTYKEMDSDCFNVVLKETGVTAGTGANLGRVCLDSQEVYSIFINGLVNTEAPASTLGVTLVRDMY